MLKRSARLTDEHSVMRRSATLAILALSLAPASASAAPITDAFARDATRGMIATRLGIGSVGVRRHLASLRCGRVRASTIRCAWTLGADGASMDAYGTGTVRILSAPGGAPPRYAYDYRGEIARRAGHDATLRYRTKRFHWRFTSPGKAAWARGATRRFEAAADAEVTDYFNRSGTTGSPVTATRPCSWSLLDDRTVAGACSAAYDAQSNGRSCRLSVAGTWAEGTLDMTVVDSSDCDGPPG